MIEAAFTDDLALLAGALRQEAFRFILINHNRKSIYKDIAQWLRSQYPDRPFFELEFRDKDYRRISDELTAIERGIVLVPDFDWLFHPENEALCIAFNQRRDFFARRPVALICFLQPSNFLLVPKKIPDWWSLRSLELEFHRELLPEDNLLQFQPLELESSSLGGISAADKKAEIERLLRQIEVADPENLGLLQSLYAQLGELYYTLSEYKEAEEYFKSSLEIAREIGDYKREGIALNNIGQIYSSLREYDKALQYLENSLKIAREIKDQVGEGPTLNNIGQIYLNKGMYDTALQYLEDSLKISQAVGDYTEIGTTLNNIGQIYSSKGAYDKALEYLKSSLRVARGVGNRAGEGASLNNISQIYYRQGNYDQALNYLEVSLKIAKETGLRAEESSTLNNIAIINYANGNYSQAFYYWQACLKVQQEIADTVGIANTLMNLGGILFQMKKPEEAFHFLIQSYDILKKIDSQNLMVLKSYFKVILAQIGEARFKELAGEQASDFLNSLPKAE